jgi:hypothetical protein
MARQSLATDDPVFDGICFHAQQAAEKYRKARLQGEASGSPTNAGAGPALKGYVLAT